MTATLLGALLLFEQVEFFEVSEGFSGWVWLACLGILFSGVRWGCGLSLFRSIAASAILLVLLPLASFVFLPLHLTVPGWVEGVGWLLAEAAVGVTVVAYGFRTGLTRRVIVSMVGAYVAVMLVGMIVSVLMTTALRDAK